MSLEWLKYTFVLIFTGSYTNLVFPGNHKLSSKPRSKTPVNAANITKSTIFEVFISVINQLCKINYFLLTYTFQIGSPFSSKLYLLEKINISNSQFVSVLKAFVLVWRRHLSESAKCLMWRIKCLEASLPKVKKIFLCFPILSNYYKLRKVIIFRNFRIFCLCPLINQACKKLISIDKYFLNRKSLSHQIIFTLNYQLTPMNIFPDPFKVSSIRRKQSHYAFFLFTIQI